VLLQDSEATLQKLHVLRNFGVRISMDDFGTGYSSLSYLRSFPFDKIKIDRSFIKDLATNSDCGAIIKAVASLGRGLGITTTAEGVETQEQLEQVRAEGCTEVQGYLFSAPQPASKVRDIVAFGFKERRAA
jgi:EAL domain-containing protein (putative c-di-GMP-specific phosphodiesterase class I)